MEIFLAAAMTNREKLFRKALLHGYRQILPFTEFHVKCEIMKPYKKNLIMSFKKNYSIQKFLKKFSMIHQTLHFCDKKMQLIFMRSVNSNGLDFTRCDMKPYTNVYNFSLSLKIKGKIFRDEKHSTVNITAEKWESMCGDEKNKFCFQMSMMS
jgi:hypothetical protein